MEITEVRVFPVKDEKLKAFVSVVLDHCFVVCDVKIIEGPSGLFISMPSKRRRDGTFRDIAHPLNHETRRMFEERVLATYRTITTEEAVGEVEQRAAGEAEGVAGSVGARRSLAGGDDPPWS